MTNKIEIVNWLEEYDFIDGNKTDNDDKLFNRVEVNSHNTDTENESESNDIGPILQKKKYYFGKDSTRWNKDVPI